MYKTAPIKKIVFLALSLFTLFVLALCYYTIEKYTLYTTMRSESIAQHSTALEKFKSGLATNLDNGHEHTSKSISYLPSTDYRNIIVRSLQGVQNTAISIYTLTGFRLVEVKSDAIADNHNNSIVGTKVDYRQLLKAVSTQQQQVSSNFSYTSWDIPCFTTVNLLSLNGTPDLIVVITSITAVSHEYFIEALSTASVLGFLVILLIYTMSIYFIWRFMRERWKTRSTIEFLAQNDPLTHLPNRAVFSETLTKSLKKASRSLRNNYVMVVDVDKFKNINDTHGHAIGDLFLQAIADRLRLVFENQLVARLSGDEFAVLLENDMSHREATSYAQRLLSAVKAPCILDGIELEMSLSIGLAGARDSLWRASKLLHCADLALYRAKQTGRSTYTWYHPSMDDELQQRRALEHEMYRALKNEGFQVEYQAQVGLQDNRLKGFEALLRWKHPVHGQISPHIFIPIAEESGQIEAIGEYVLKKACKDAANWEDENLRVAVNISPAQFKSGHIENKVRNALKEANLKPERLEIEITESLLISDTKAVIQTLKSLHKMGVSIAMDDFGTGYSSLSYLSKFPFNKIKIDRSFIQRLGQDTHTDAVIAAIIGLGRSLNLLITAEGVENETQARLLKAGGCDLVQGFYYGKPQPVNPKHPSENIRCLNGF